MLSKLIDALDVSPGFVIVYSALYHAHTLTQKNNNENINQRSLRDSTILHGVCVGEMLVLKY